MNRHSCLPKRWTTSGRYHRASALFGAAALVLATGELAALPIAQPPLPATAVVPAQERATPQQAQAEPATPFDELNESLEAARARLEELSKAAEVAAAAARMRRELTEVKAENQRLQEQLAAAGDGSRRLREAEAEIATLTEQLDQAERRTQELDEQLAALRWRNAQVNTTLEQVQAAREQAEREAVEREAAATNKVEALTRAVEQSVREITRLGEELEASEQRATAATSARNEAEAQLVELQETLSQETASKEQIERELAQARAEAAAAIEERDRSAAAQASAQGDLRTAQNELGELRLSNERLETEVAALREAAAAAATAARRNLITMESRIDELDRALALVLVDDPAAIAPGAGRPDDEIGVADGPAAASPTEADDQVDVADGPAAASPTEAGDEVDVASEGAAIAPPTEADAVGSTNAESFGPAPLPAAAAAQTGGGSADGDLELIKAATAATPSVAETLARLTADLPLEKRLQAQALMADLAAEATEEGLKMTVPGAALFELNSDRIQRSAHDTLAKVAELIDVYDQNPILIRGHTDAVGEAAYNQQLSERRASLVKQFFVDNFDIEAARLQSEGRGERQPIASNATLDGRRANRRVEVVILD